ncbi:hypothetical protein AAG570_001652 [Ranatra chinensis]|uniref:Sodium/potassium-transporting ATPase subunit beta-2 n=1 Tax=Ranatra chinensis TaxID=642074 RepID=A0ABD0YL54_9HEMI
MKGLMSTISEQHPRYQLDESLIGTNPGMGFRPMPPNIEEGSVIWFVPSNESNIKYWINSIDEFLAEYTDDQKVKGNGLNRQICDYDKPPAEGKVCTVDLNSKAWGPCTKKNRYGYSSSSPCVFLKLNRIYGWEPEYYNETKTIPEDMPDALKDYIKKHPKKLNTIWVSCHGEGPTDNEYVGPIEYYPQPGFPGYFYPYINTEGYLSPLVAVNFKRPLLNRLINIECRVWAKNVYYRKSTRDREGSVHFELLID